MSSPISVGYLRPDPSRIRADRPQVRAGGRPVIDMAVPDWHYLTDITVEWDLEVDLDGLTKDCGLPADARIGATLAWRSERTNLRGNGHIVDVVTGHNYLTTLLRGADLGRSVSVEARILLLGSPDTAEQLAPRRPGSLLWQLAEQITLEGSGGRFPTTATDFSSAGLPGGDAGMWYLQVTDSNLGASVTQALRLYVNNTNPVIRGILDNPAADASLPVLQFLRYDTTRQLLMTALTDEEFDDRAAYERGTLGDVLVTLLRVYFPSRDIAQLRNDYRLNPADLDSELLAAVWRTPR